MYRIFLPFVNKDEILYLHEDYVNQTITVLNDDDDFLSLLDKHFAKIKTDIVINKLSFRNITAYKPSDLIDDFYYIEVNQDLIPRQIIETERKEIDKAYFDPVYEKTVKSENYYKYLYTRLDYGYINPYLKNEDGEEFQFNDYNILLNESKLLLIGGPGAGKSSMLRKLTYEILKKHEKRTYNKIFPIYIKLRDFNHLFDQRSIHRIIDKQFELLNKDFVIQAQKEKKIIFIFDGFDELEAENRKKFVEYLDYSQKKNDEFRMIISSRKISELNKYSYFDTFSRIEILPFNFKQIQSFVLRNIIDDNEKNNFISLININHELQKLLGNPLLLSLTIGLYTINKMLPSNLSLLIEEIVKHLTERWDSSRLIYRYKHINPEDTKYILGNISFNLLKDQKQTFDDKYALECLPRKYKKAKILDLLCEISETTNLIYNSYNKWSFTHVFFKEFFCANYLIDKSRGIEAEYEEFGNNIKWKNVWNTAISKSTDPEFYIRKKTKDNLFINSLETNRILNILHKAQYKGEDTQKKLIKILKELTSKLNEELSIRFYTNSIEVELAKESKISQDLYIDFINIFSLIGLEKNEYSKSIINYESKNDLDKLVNILSKEKCYIENKDGNKINIKILDENE